MVGVKLFPNVLVGEVVDDAEHQGVHQRFGPRASDFRNRHQDPRGQYEEERDQKQRKEKMHAHVAINDILFFLARPLSLIAAAFVFLLK
jgi:hypothetical protein